MPRKDAAGRREGERLLCRRAGGRFRHCAADGKLFQSFSQVFLTGENAGHTVECVSDLNLLV